jgi:Asp-tRNA(Asn)/Glu-tRNA(Gln) amidotransferase A subunit family amidase
MDFRKHTIEALVGDVRAGRTSAVALTRAALANIETTRSTINAFCAVDPDLALAAARVIDARIAEGDPVGPLAGIPCGVKDLEDAKGFVTTFGSALHTSDAPAAADSVLVARLKAAGAVIIGKTNTPEFGYKGVTDNKPFGATRNPWNTAHSAGGSSGGSAAALAAGVVPLATGSDGGGSIRIPSAVCGMSGIKASQGRVPVGGPVPPGSGLLTVKGPMALRTRDIALALDAVCGNEATDLFGLPDLLQPLRPQLDRDNRPRRVLWSPTMGFAKVDSEILSQCEAAIGRLADAGVEIIERKEIWAEDPVLHWYQFWTAARARAQGDLRNTPQWQQIDDDLKPQIEYGLEKVTGVTYARAIDACHTLAYELSKALSDAPFIVTPCTAGHTPRIGTAMGKVDGTDVPGWVGFTYGINMTRNPAGTVRAGTTKDGLPVGLQIIGAQRDDLGVLKAMCFMEDVLGYAHDAPHGVTIE